MAVKSWRWNWILNKCNLQRVDRQSAATKNQWPATIPSASKPVAPRGGCRYSGSKDPSFTHSTRKPRARNLYEFSICDISRRKRGIHVLSAQTRELQEHSRVSGRKHTIRRQEEWPGCFVSIYITHIVCRNTYLLPVHEIMFVYLVALDQVPYELFVDRKYYSNIISEKAGSLYRLVMAVILRWRATVV